MGIGTETTKSICAGRKKRPLVQLLHSVENYVGEFGLEDHHAGEVMTFIGERMARREATSVILPPSNATTPRKKKMVTVDEINTWYFYDNYMNSHEFNSLEA